MKDSHYTPGTRDFCTQKSPDKLIEHGRIHENLDERKNFFFSLKMDNIKKK
jgi:hypothetical protein